ncbi:MAG TPA: S8 family serine peptidase [Rhizomicrobium sp.]|nr:S8 family serine peptidase [Rhizomicrobium sp.]
MLRRHAHISVAAAGNGGPAADPNYPAAYPGVVTSVDNERRLEFDASRGEAQFAALGVGARAAALPQGHTNITGTSYATPAIAARFARLLRLPDFAKARDVFRQLSQAAIPLDSRKNAPKYLDASFQTDRQAAVSADAR